MDDWIAYHENVRKGLEERLAYYEALRKSMDFILENLAKTFPPGIDSHEEEVLREQDERD